MNTRINSHNGSPAYAEAALADEIGIIGSTPKGRGLRNAAINRGAFKIGSLVGAGALSESVAHEALMSAARANERISWTADQVLTANRDGDEKPERSEAEEFLRDILSDGPRPSTEVEAEAKGAGVAWRTVRRAQKNLGIKPFRKAEAGDGLGKSGRWYWALPGGDDAPNMASFSYDGHVSDVDTLANSGQLSGNGGGK
jgi:hypothetical protein